MSSNRSIDLTNMSDEEKPRVAAFFQDSLRHKYAAPVIVWENVPYYTNSSSEWLRFSQSLYLFTSKKDASRCKFAVQGCYLDKGAFGEVSIITHTVKLDSQDQLVVSPKTGIKQRVVKVIYANKKWVSKVEAASNEYKLMHQAGYFHAKNFEMANDEYRITIIMHRFPGETLHAIMKKHQKQEKPLTVLQRLEISLQLFEAYRDQVASKGIVHRDIKLENILVDISPEGLIKSVNFIDLGLAKKQEITTERDCVGSPIYYSPEHVGKGTTTSSDLYSLGRVLWRVWDFDVDHHLGFKENCEKQSIFDLEITKRYLSIYFNLKPDQFDFLFANTPGSDISLNVRNKLMQFIILLNAYQEADRPSLAQAINLLKDCLRKHTFLIRQGRSPHCSVLELPEYNNRLQAEAQFDLHGVAINQQNEAMEEVQLASRAAVTRATLSSRLSLFQSANNPAQPHQAADDHSPRAAVRQ